MPSVILRLSVCAAGAGGDVSQDAEVDLSSSGLTELDLGADEVFLVSSPSSPSRLPFCPHTVRPHISSLVVHLHLCWGCFFQDFLLSKRVKVLQEQKA